jgi:hypothetical protein
MATKQSDQDTVALELFSLVQIAERQSYKETETVLLFQFISQLAFIQTTKRISADLHYSLQGFAAVQVWEYKWYAPSSYVTTQSFRYACAQVFHSYSSMP